MPTIRVELMEGRTVEQKRSLARALTEAAVNVLGSSAASVDVVFYDVARHDWATGGTLWSDRPAVVTPEPLPGTDPQAAKPGDAAG